MLVNANTSSISLQSAVSTSNTSSFSNSSTNSVFSSLKKNASPGRGHTRGRSEQLLSTFTSFSNNSNNNVSHKRGRSVSPVKSYISSDQDTYYTSEQSSEIQSLAIPSTQISSPLFEAYGDDEILFRSDNIIHRTSDIHSPIRSPKLDYILVNDLPYPLKIVFPQKISKKNLQQGREDGSLDSFEAPITPVKLNKSNSNTPTRIIPSTLTPLVLSPVTSHSNYTTPRSLLPSPPPPPPRMDSPLNDNSPSSSKSKKISKISRLSHKKSRSLGSISALAQLSSPDKSEQASPSHSRSHSQSPSRRSHMKEDSRVLSTVVELDPFQEREISKPTRAPLLEKKSRLKLLIPKGSERESVNLDNNTNITNNNKRHFSGFSLKSFMKRSESQNSFEADLIQDYFSPDTSSSKEEPGIVSEVIKESLYPTVSAELDNQETNANVIHEVKINEKTEISKDNILLNETKDAFDMSPSSLPNLFIPKNNKSKNKNMRLTSYEYAPLSVYMNYMEEQRRLSLQKQQQQLQQLKNKN